MIDDDVVDRSLEPDSDVPTPYNLSSCISAHQANPVFSLSSPPFSLPLFLSLSLSFSLFFSYHLHIFGAPPSPRGALNPRALLQSVPSTIPDSVLAPRVFVVWCRAPSAQMPRDASCVRLSQQHSSHLTPHTSHCS